MDVREKLLELLKGSKLCSKRFDDQYSDSTIAIIADHLISNGVTVQQWIPVTDRLPKLIPCRAGTAYSEAVNVLTSGRKVITAIYDGTDWLAPFGFWDAEDEVITHWAPVLLPLPEPLEDGTV